MRTTPKLTIPASEGPSKQLSLRAPERLVERIDRLAKARGLSRTDVVLLLLRWSLDQTQQKVA